MTMPPVSYHAGKSRASALVITLAILVLITVIVVGYISSVMFETKASRTELNEEKAHDMAMLAMHCAVGRMRDALGSGTNSWDNPFGNFMGTSGSFRSPTFFWSISPGLLTRWEYSVSNYKGGQPTFANLPDADKIALFSGTSVSVSGTLGPTVNLNRQKADGSYPIISGSMVSGTMAAPPVSVQWENVLSDPSNSTASGTNQIVGRYAFWVDDENAKININTADGTNKADPGKSLGAGSPTEVSLQVLSGTGGVAMSGSTATNIVQIARTTGFHSPHEILRAEGTTPDLFSNNVFNITTCSRSPEVNIFGGPKIALIPAQSNNNGNEFTSGVLQKNYITMQPLREIYPTPQQLNPITFNFTDVFQIMTTGSMMTHSTSNVLYAPVFAQGRGARNDYEIDNADYIYINLYSLLPDTLISLVSDYLTGKNPAGNSVYTWPAFPGATATTFVQSQASTQTGTYTGNGKYSTRQIDSIVSEIYDVAAKATSSDYYNPAVYSNVSAWQQTYSAPTAALGFLSAQPVPGMGRCPKITKFLLKLTTQGSFTTTGSSGQIYTPPKVEINTWMEWWFPAHYEGLSMWNKSFNISNQGLRVGAGSFWVNYLNTMDKGYSQILNTGTGSLNAPQVWGSGPQAWPAIIPKADGSSSYWGNQLLRNDQGIDILGNPEIYPDPDQGLATQAHPYLASTGGTVQSGTNGIMVTWNSPEYLGSSPNPVGTKPANPQVYAVLCMNGLMSNSTTDEWAPGEIRHPGSARSGVKYSMSNTSGGKVLTISGGLTCLSTLVSGGDPDPVPLEAEFSQWFLNNASPKGIPDTRVNYPAINSGTAKTLRDRLLGSVVPMNGQVPVPADADGGASSNVVYIYSSVAADPLVNKFPGDWITTTSSINPSSLGGTQTYPTVTWESPASTICQPDPASGWYDPDSYWMPTMDSSLYQNDSPAIPRSARFPSSGYLQYLRTGLVPDDETLPYTTGKNVSAGDYTSDTIQHGTPYRLFNFAPSTDASQKTNSRKSYSYPDWAMLDLFYTPSMLLAYGSPYATYAGAKVTTNMTPGTYTVDISYQNKAAANNMFSYGSYGGATSGRINPNGAVIYTTDVTTPAKDNSKATIVRTVPLRALFHGISVNQNLVGSSKGGYKWQNGMVVDDAALANAVVTYIQKNGPLRMPGEICNVDEIAQLAPANGNSNNGNNGPYSSPVNNPTRNDLVRQVVGNITTQSNTFSVWVAGQSVQKVRGNTKYGEFEKGDNVLSEVRYHFIVERYLDPGADGVYGNMAQSGGDGVVGTVDDVGQYLDVPTDKKTNPTPQNHPLNPTYLYRVIYSEKIQ